MKILAVLFSVAAVALARHEIYQGYKSYYVATESYEQQLALGPIADQFSVDVLSPPLVEREGVVLVAPEHQEGFTKALREQGIQYRVHRDDVKAALEYDDAESEAYTSSVRAKNGGRSFDHSIYNTLSDIYSFMDDVARRYPNIAQLVTPANSYHGRPIRYLKISTTNFQDARKPVIFIDGGIHAREWISPPTLIWGIHELVSNLTAPDLLNNYDYVFLPVVNPDGYEHTKTGNGRFWRKTRSSTTSASCIGVDGNRNFDFAWGTTGTSSNPCADTYPGNRAFSEPETRVVRDILHEHLHRMPLYLTIHSYGSMVLYPWGHNSTLSTNALIQHAVGVAQANAIQALQLASFPQYRVGNSALVIGYQHSGSSQDYAHSIGVPLSYTYELPGLSGGLNGFHLPPQWISRVVQETWAGISAAIRQANAYYPRS